MSSSVNQPMDRRQFIKITGICALAALIGGGCVAFREDETGRLSAACPYGLSYDPYPGQCRDYIDSNSSGFCDRSEDATTTSLTGDVTTTSTAGQQPTAIPSGSAAQPAPGAVALCHRNCRAPGRCGRFSDRNSSGICDRSETINTSESG